MDKLDEIFGLQAELDAYIKAKRETAELSKEEWIQKKCLALLDETAELLNEVNYKWWKNPKPFNRDAVCEELVDMLHFWVSMCVDAGLTPEKIYETYRYKNRVNRARQDGKSEKPGYSVTNSGSDA